MRLRFTIRGLLWLTLVVAMAVGWWIDGRSHGYGFRYDQTVTSLENRVKAQADKIDVLKADNSKLFDAEEDRIKFLKADNAKLRQELDRLDSHGQDH
jgi:hypothetical protein